MDKRQLINIAARPSKSSSTATPSCTAFTLPSNGVLTLNSSTTITLSSDAIYQPSCTESSDVIIAGSGAADHIHFRDPFYASTLPECYALAATTVIAYMLVIMLFITPRTFLHEGALVLGRGGFTNGPSGSDAGFGIGGRPWLQKAAALTVAISLSIATADTFKVAEAQYKMGYMDAQALQKKVEDGSELKVIRVISDTFLWLAQAQTLIRLFPRQREKVIIKWTAFSLITLDELFSILNAFAYEGSSRPRSFVDAVPALAYLFQLALSLLYAAWVIYYSITKKRFAFYHPQMKNICLVALLSLISVLIPVVFFVTDISKPDLAGWGDYVRWVGAAAASVVVWEWVERIEALERNAKKDGVLGREVFDGDEMLDASPSADLSQDVRLLKSSKKSNRYGGENSSGDSSSSKETGWSLISSVTNFFRNRGKSDIESGHSESQTEHQKSRCPKVPARLHPVATYISQVDTASAESTIYAINPPRATSPHISPVLDSKNSQSNGSEYSNPSKVSENHNIRVDNTIEKQRNDSTSSVVPPLDFSNYFAIINPFIKKKHAPPQEKVSAKTKSRQPERAQSTSSKWKLRSRLEDLAVNRAEILWEKRSQREISTEILPKTVIPAPPRRTNLTATFHQLEKAERSGSNKSHM